MSDASGLKRAIWVGRSISGRQKRSQANARVPTLVYRRSCTDASGSALVGRGWRPETGVPRLAFPSPFPAGNGGGGQAKWLQVGEGAEVAAIEYGSVGCRSVGCKSVVYKSISYKRTSYESTVYESTVYKGVW